MDVKYKILDKSFMKTTFEEYMNELPPMKEYWTLMFEKKRMRIVSPMSGASVLQFAHLKEELFRPKDKTNKRRNVRLLELAKVAADAIVDELGDKKKASRKYLSISNSSHSRSGCLEEVKTKLLGREATNDKSKSALGGATQQIQ